MKHLIVYAHPNSESLSAAYMQEMADETRKNGHEVIVRDLYNMDFNPVVEASEFEMLQRGEVKDDIRREQEFFSWANMITFIYPIWWSGMPAILKGYIDRVFTRGFAYTSDINGAHLPLLKGKKVMIINNMGASETMYESSGMSDAIKKVQGTGIFDFVGMQIVEHRLFGSAASVSEGKRKEYIEETRRLVVRNLEYCYA